MAGKVPSITFKTGDGFTTAMLLTRTLENIGAVGSGAYASLEGKLLEEGYINRELSAMELALQKVKEHGIKTLDEMAQGIEQHPQTQQAGMEKDSKPPPQPRGR